MLTRISTIRTAPTAAIYNACLITSPISLYLLAPRNCDTEGVTACRTPVINIIIGHITDPPSETPARSSAPTRPAMTVSTTPMPICASCAASSGQAKCNKEPVSVRNWRTGEDLGDMSIEARIKVDVLIETQRSNYNACVYSGANDTTGDSD